MKLTLSSVAVAATLWLVTGCGSMESGGVVTAEPTPGNDASAGGTELTIVVRDAPGKGERTYRLECDPAGGYHPDPESACQSLSALKDPFTPVPPDAMCTEIYGGPQTATVTGTFRGEPVNAEFSRTNGCEIARWDSHVALLVDTGGAEDR